MDSNLAHLISWTEYTKGDVPPPLTGPSITISPLPSPHPPTIFLFGGKHNRQLTNEMWAMDLSSRVWTRIDAGDGPAPRYFHSMDVWEDKLVCFGGMSESEPMSVHNDIWFFDCQARRWLPQSRESDLDSSLIPSPRYAHLSAVSRGQLMISGGQHSDNSWVYEMNMYDLRQRRWVSKTMQPELQGQHSKGAYRSIATSSKQRVITPKAGDMKNTSAQSYSIDEEGEGGEIWSYSNYDFAKVRRELDFFTPSDEVVDNAPESDHYASPPSFSVTEQSNRVKSGPQPPGLRFPTGGIVGNHFILCGLYLATSTATFSIWALDLGNMIWKRLEPAALATGSWNRAVVWPDKAKVLVFGNAEYDIIADYGRRAVNLDQMAIVSLETWGIYRPPRLEVPAKIQEVGLSMLDEKLASDFEVECEDGRKIKCSRQILLDRWKWFRDQDEKLNHRLTGVVRDAPALDITDTLLGNFTPARLSTTSLIVPEPFPVCVALVQYFYTLSLSTPLQNRAPVLSALLFLAKQYSIDRLSKLVVHALHERLEPALAAGIYEIATLAGEQDLQVRALNMIHSAKTGSTSRSHRQGPSSSFASEGGRSSSPAPGTGPSGPAPTDHSGGNSGEHRATGAEDTFRRARAESMTLGDEAADHAHSLLAALSIAARDIPSPSSPTDPDHNRSAQPAPAVPRRNDSRPPPALSPAPTTRQRHAPVPHLHTPELSDEGDGQRPSSPTNSDATSAYPATPCESLRESFILPSHLYPSQGYFADSRASSTSGHIQGGYGNMALPPLPEDRTSLNRFRTVNGSMSSQHSLRSQGSLKSDRLDRHNSEKSVDRGSLADRVHSDRIKPSTLETAGLCSRPPPSSLSSYQAQAISGQFSSDCYGRYQSKPKHFSVATSSSMSSGSSSKYDGKSMMVPSSPVGTEYSFILDDPPQTHPITMHHHVQHMGSMSTINSFGHQSHLTRTLGPASSMGDSASIITTSSGSSDKKAAKAERKAIAEAAKAAKKAEAQAKFEALRSEQMHKMALAKVEAQRRAEAAKFEPPAPKEQPKSKFGKFGAKITDAILFPAGSNNSTMF